MAKTDHRNIDHITQAKRAQVAQNVLDHIKKSQTSRRQPPFLSIVLPQYPAASPGLVTF